MNLFYDQYIHYKRHVFVILLLMPGLEPPMCISGVYSFPLQCGGSLRFLPVLGHGSYFSIGKTSYMLGVGITTLLWAGGDPGTSGAICMCEGLMEHLEVCSYVQGASIWRCLYIWGVSVQGAVWKAIISLALQSVVTSYTLQLSEVPRSVHLWSSPLASRGI